MAKKLTSIFWGAVWILGGVYTLARTMGVEAIQDMYDCPLFLLTP
jgi:hypothetical protein